METTLFAVVIAITIASPKIPLPYKSYLVSTTVLSFDNMDFGDILYNSSNGGDCRRTASNTTSIRHSRKATSRSIVVASMASWCTSSAVSMGLASN